MFSYGITVEHHIKSIQLIFLSIHFLMFSYDEQ